MLSKRDVQILAACVIALGAFRVEHGLTGAADISHLSLAELERGEALLDTLTEDEVAAALRATEARLSSAEQLS
jgi:hypothetical protein